MSVKLKMNWQKMQLYFSFFFSEGCIFTLQVPLPSVVSVQGANQRRLYNNLMKDYYRLERPVVNDSHTLTVQFGLSLMQIIDVVRKKKSYINFS